MEGWYCYGGTTARKDAQCVPDKCMDDFATLSTCRCGTELCEPPQQCSSSTTTCSAGAGCLDISGSWVSHYTDTGIYRERCDVEQTDCTATFDCTLDVPGFQYTATVGNDGFVFNGFDVTAELQGDGSIVMSHGFTLTRPEDSAARGRLGQMALSMTYVLSGVAGLLAVLL